MSGLVRVCLHGLFENICRQFFGHPNCAFSLASGPFNFGFRRCISCCAKLSDGVQLCAVSSFADGSNSLQFALNELKLAGIDPSTIVHFPVTCVQVSLVLLPDGTLSRFCLFSGAISIWCARLLA